MRENSREQVKQITTATLRAISGVSGIPVSFSTSGNAVSNNKVCLSLSDRGNLSPNEIDLLRGRVDAAAMHLRFHNSALQLASTPAHPESRKLFDLLEQTRVECLGSLRMAGTAKNLNGLLEYVCLEQGWHGAETRADIPMIQGVSVLVRMHLLGAELPPTAMKAACLWKGMVEEHASLLFDALDEHIKDQSRYSKCSIALIDALGLQSAPIVEGPLKEPAVEVKIDDTQQQADPRQNDGVVDPQSSASMQGEEGETKEENSTPKGGPKRLQFLSEQLDPSKAIETNYTRYSGAFDEEVEALALAEAEELDQLRCELDSQLPGLQSIVVRLANRLQRHLLVQQRRAWAFDQEEGILDCARLARVVANPTLSLSYKRDKPAEFKDTIVTLLIDNSGSMRGRPIAIAALSADILARTLERCGVKVEVLGFTTKSWKGGRVREQWINEGAPTSPGRLNELRHIIYKPANLPWRRVKNRFGLMLKKGILKENIDGEALVWAYSRLMTRPEERKIMLVISDGEPVDDATLLSNSENYLADHLRTVIEWMERKTPVQLAAIGIGHDVTHYYRHAVMLKKPEDLGGAILHSLADLLGVNRVASKKE